MAGTKEGGAKAAATNLARYGADFYVKLGKQGGAKSRNGGFASVKLGTDGLTGPERASIVGVIGGQTSRRYKKVQQ